MVRVVETPVFIPYTKDSILRKRLQDPGSPALPKPSKEQVRASPKCTSEGFGYLIECWPCRLEGKMFTYVGESSRSPYQRGREHWQELEMRKPTHPLVIHSEEEHEGREI